MNTCIYIPIQVAKVIYINPHRTGNIQQIFIICLYLLEERIVAGFQKHCSVFNRDMFRRAFADVQSFLIPEVSACTICRDGKLLNTDTQTHILSFLLFSCQLLTTRPRKGEPIIVLGVAWRAGSIAFVDSLASFSFCNTLVPGSRLAA